MTPWEYAEQVALRHSLLLFGLAGIVFMASAVRWVGRSARS